MEAGFFDKLDGLYKYNRIPDMAKPPLSRQIWIIRRRSYISNRRCSLRIAVGKQNTPDNITVLYFHLLADVFIFISASAAGGI